MAHRRGRLWLSSDATAFFILTAIILEMTHTASVSDAAGVSGFSHSEFSETPRQLGGIGERRGGVSLM